MVKFKTALRRVWERMFNLFFNFYYKYGSCVEPYKYYMEGFSHLDKEEQDDGSKSYGMHYEPSCFPLPFKINCVGCYGCIHNGNPIFSPPKSKGPYQVMLADTFKAQYTGMFGKEALFELMWKLEKHNLIVEKGVN